MTTMNLRKVGGSVAVVIPPNMLKSLNLAAGSSVDLSIADSKIQIQASKAKPKYSLDQLLAQSDYQGLQDAIRNGSETDELNDWVNDEPMGNELI